MVQATDWVQAKVQQVEEDFMGEKGNTLVHAKVGAIGHVLAVEFLPEADAHCATVYWERTGTTCDVDVRELEFLCHADEGKRAFVTDRR